MFGLAATPPLLCVWVYVCVWLWLSVCLCVCFVCACVCVCVCVCARVLTCACSGGCGAAQSPGRTEWIYKLMEFKASSIDYHYNKQQHRERLIIFRQRFCALSSNSADAVTRSDICL